MRYLNAVFCFGIIFLFSTTCFADKFPYRDEYPELNIIELSELKSGYDFEEFLLIDVRSKTEFETIRIKHAINIPYADARFTGYLGQIVEENPDKKIVVYGNGGNSIKSYKAAEDAKHAILPHVYAFDAGILAWAKAYPSETYLLTDILKDSEKQLIAEEQFIKRNIDFESFKKMAVKRNAVLIDARDPIQRIEKIKGLEKALPISMDKLVKNVISKGRHKDKQLLIFDQVGGQVNWLMYYLVDNGYTNFYFLNGGATAILHKQEYRLTYIQ